MHVADRELILGPLLGSGGFGEVYEATLRTSSGLQRPVAVKVLHAHHLFRTDAVDRLRDEAALLARMQHPVIVSAIELMWIDDRPALVTELVRGLDLEQCLRLPSAPGPRALVHVTAQVASALEAGEPLRVIHRDIKPSNVRIGHHGEVRLLDFGIARFSSDDRHAHTETDVVVGSATYMAPERFVSRDSRPAVDIFSLGCCLFEGLAQARFHDKDALRHLGTLATAPDRYEAHLEARIAALSEPEGAVGALIRACLAYSPRDRPSARELAERCEHLTDELDGPTLRQWCAATAWPSPPEQPGTLSGRTVGGSRVRHESVRNKSRKGPTIVRTAPVTRDNEPDPADAPTVIAARSEKPGRRLPLAPLAIGFALAIGAIGWILFG